MSVEPLCSAVCADGSAEIGLDLNRAGAHEAPTKPLDRFKIDRIPMQCR